MYTANRNKLRSGLATRILEQRYKKRFDPEASPDLFEHQAEVKDPESGQVISEERTYLKLEIERELHTLHMVIEDALDYLQD